MTCTATLEETLDLLITPHRALALQDVRQNLVIAEDIQHLLLARELRQGLKLSLDDGGVMHAPNFLETTFEAKRGDTLRLSQIAHLRKLNLVGVVGFAAHEVGYLLHKLEVHHHFPEGDVRVHFPSNLVHGQEFPSGNFFAKDGQCLSYRDVTECQPDSWSLSSDDFQTLLPFFGGNVQGLIVVIFSSGHWFVIAQDDTQGFVVIRVIYARCYSWQL